MLRRFILGLTLLGALVGGTVVFAQAQAIKNGGDIPLGERPWHIAFTPGTASVALTTYLMPDRPQGYRLWLGRGRKLHLSLRGAFSLQVYDPQGRPVTPVSTPPGPLTVDITQTGDYGIALQGVDQATVLIYVPPLAADQAAPVPPPAAVGRLPAPPGAGAAAVSVRLDPTRPQGYQFSAPAGQVVTVTLTGSAIPALLAPDGTALGFKVSDAGAYTFEPLPVDGDYTLELNGGGNVTFTFGLAEAGALAGATPAPDWILAPPPAQPTATDAPPTASVAPPAERPRASWRIVFPPGGTLSDSASE